MRLFVLFALIVSLTGCMTGPMVSAAQPGADGEMITISSEMGECISCKRFELRVPSDGPGMLSVYLVQLCRAERCSGEGELVRSQKLHLSYDQYRRLYNILAPLRPAGTKVYSRCCDGMTGEGCGDYWTDQASYHVDWVGRGPPARLTVDFGCRAAEPMAARATIDKAIASLGLKGVPLTPVAAGTALMPDR